MTQAQLQQKQSTECEGTARNNSKLSGRAEHHGARSLVLILAIGCSCSRPTNPGYLLQPFTYSAGVQGRKPIPYADISSPKVSVGGIAELVGLRGRRRRRVDHIFGDGLRPLHAAGQTGSGLLRPAGKPGAHLGVYGASRRCV